MFMLIKNYDLNCQIKHHMEELSDRILGSGFSVSPTSYQNWITNLAKVDTEILKVGSSERQ